MTCVGCYTTKQHEVQQWNDEDAVWRKTKIKREVTGVTEGLAIWNETTLCEKRSVGTENLESVLTCSNHIYPPVSRAKICVCGIAEPPYTPPTVQVMAQYAGAH